jgi:transposase-like protein
MKDQKKPQVTNEKKCPACGSDNVLYQEVGHGVGAGPGEPNIQRLQFKCTSCEEVFWYTGEVP